MERVRIELKLDTLIEVYDSVEREVKHLWRELTPVQRVHITEWFKAARQMSNELLASDQVNEYRASVLREAMKGPVARRSSVQVKGLTCEDLL